MIYMLEISVCGDSCIAKMVRAVSGAVSIDLGELYKYVMRLGDTMQRILSIDFPTCNSAEIRCRVRRIVARTMTLIYFDGHSSSR